MFRLIRLIAAVLIAFVAGMLFERAAQRDACAAAGGTWDAQGVCIAVVSGGRNAG